MKKQNWMCGILLAAAFLMTGTSFASPQSDGIYNEPASDHMFILATWPPLVPANKLDDSDTVTAMATSDNDNEINSGTCMACLDNKRTSVGLKYFQAKATGFKRVMLACGKVSEPANVPTKIPTAV